MLRLRLASLLFLSSLAAASGALAGCDSGSGTLQRAFEDRALLSPPSGVTQTDAAGRVLSRDSSDWQIGPLFAGRAAFLQLPSPNPAVAGQAVTFLVDARGEPGGLELLAVSRRSGTSAVELVAIPDPGARRADATAPGFYEFRVSANQIAAAGGGNRLTRVVLVTGADRVVSFGDVEVVPR